jgi:hypothetical protein
LLAGVGPSSVLHAVMLMIAAVACLLCSCHLLLLAPCCDGQDCFTDFRMAPSGAATWLYVLHGVKVLALLPPTAHNRYRV